MPFFIKAQTTDPFLQLTPHVVKEMMVQHFKPAPGHVSISSFSTAILFYEDIDATHHALNSGKHLSCLLLEDATYDDIKDASSFVSRITGHVFALDADVRLSFLYQLFLHKEALEAYWSPRSHSRNSGGSAFSTLPAFPVTPHTRMRRMRMPPTPLIVVHAPESPTPSSRAQAHSVVHDSLPKDLSTKLATVSKTSFVIVNPPVPRQAVGAVAGKSPIQKKPGRRAPTAFKEAVRKSARLVGLAMKGKSADSRGLKSGKLSEGPK